MGLPDFPVPAFSTIRDWVLKLGLYNLEMPRERGNWVWIIDVSIQMGAMKCVYVLGVNMDKLKGRKDYTITSEDVVPLVLKTVASCTGEVIQEALIEAERKTGTATVVLSGGGTEISETGVTSVVLSDEGTDIGRGVKLYSKGKNIIHLHDILHKVDLILKKELEKDEIWKGFTKQMTDTIQRLKLTTSAHLGPPRQRQKGRLRGELKVIEWGLKIVEFLASGKGTALEKEKLSWVFDYKSVLNEYKEIANIFDMTVSEVRENGYYRGINKIIEQCGFQTASMERSQCFLRKVLKALSEEESKVPEGMRLVGSTEILESMFGRFKQLEKSHSSGGLTSLVLSLPAMIGQWSSDQLKAAMEWASIEKVQDWVETNLGVTFWARRRKDFKVNDGCMQQDDVCSPSECYLESDDSTEAAYT